MTRANTEQSKHTPWFAKAGAACSIIPISRFVSPSIFALKGGGFGVDVGKGIVDRCCERHFVISCVDVELERGRGKVKGTFS